MKKILMILFFAINTVLVSCGAGPREESDDKDSIDAARAADSMLREQLNSDTSMNTDSTTDNMPTDSMQNKSQQKP